MKNIDKILNFAREQKCSDIHITDGEGIIVRKDGKMHRVDVGLPIDKIVFILKEMLNDEQAAQLDSGKDVDFCYVMDTGERQRVNMYHQQDRVTAAIRILNTQVPSMSSFDFPPVIEALTHQPRGLILVTGPTGSGKTTTLAAMIDAINASRKGHILTIEDPIEYIHPSKECVVHQREVGRDIDTFEHAIKSAMRQDPDVILVGEMRDLETISAALTAAETGHLVLGTLHTTGAANTINRIIDVFPPHGQAQIRMQLASSLKGVISQQLLPLADGKGRCMAMEVLVVTDAVSSMIRDNKSHQINATMQTGSRDGMMTLNASLLKLAHEGKVAVEDAMHAASDKDEFMRMFNRS
ncbi:MAG: type IV pilus twitching motility protein PilT [Cellulosilyticaceae bacterium]